MKKAAMVLGAGFFVSAILTGASFAADKFGTVDLAKTFSEYKKTKDYDKALGDREQVYTAERDKKVNELKQLQDKLNLLSEKEKESKKTDLDTKVKDFQEFDRQKQTDLRKEQDEKMKELLKDIEDAVKQYSEKEGFTMVFNDRILVYQNKALDITDKVIEILNKDSSSAGTKTKK